MKKHFLLLLFICTLSSISAQKHVNKFIDNMKEDNAAVALTLPGWLIKMGINISVDNQEKAFMDEYEDILDGIKSLRILAIPHAKGIKTKDLKMAMDIFKEKDGYVDYARIQDQGEKMYVLVREDGTKVKNLLVLVDSAEEFVVLSMKTNVDMDKLVNANISFNKDKKEEKELTP